MKRRWQPARMGPVRLFAALLILVLAAPASADVTGRPRVVDGDTLEVAGAPIDLLGIDAPETDQPCTSSKGRPFQCGKLATRALAGIVGGREVTCKGEQRDGDGRLSATCFIGWLNVNEKMVADGWAMADRPRSKAYVRAEVFARARREGLWRGTFEPPWQWRKANR